MDQLQTVTFEMTADDQVAGTKLSLLRVLKKPVRPMTIILGAGTVLIFVLTLVGFVKKGELSLIPLLPLILLAVFGLVLYFVTSPHAARRNFKHNKSAHHPITLSWDEIALDFRSNGNRSRIEWSDLYRSMENGKVMLFFVSPQMMFVLPKRVFTAAQIEQLRGYAGLNQPRA